MAIEIRHDKPRGCGLRKPGGLYFVSDGPGIPCGRLPVALDRCPTCDHGIKPARGTQWLDAGEFMTKRSCIAPAEQCMSCPTITGKQILIWIGEAFYKTPHDWMAEANTQGVSRRIPAVPRSFVIGENWVLVAHRKCVALSPTDERVCGEEFTSKKDGPLLPQKRRCAKLRDHEDEEHDDSPQFLAGIFHAFRPTAVEYVTTGSETAEEIEALEKRGITPVQVFVDGKPLEEALKEQKHSSDDDGLTAA